MPAALLSNHSTTTTPVIEDYYITGRHHRNNNKNNHKSIINDEELSDDGTTDDDDESLDYNSDDDDDDNSMLSFSTVGSERVVGGDNLNSNSCNNDHSNNNHNNNNNNNKNSNKEGGTNYLDNILAEEILHDYNDGDLQILNSLVNKLHEADVRRRNKIENHPQHQRQQQPHEQLQYSSSSPPPPSHHQDDGLLDDLPSEMPLHPPPFSPLKSTIISLSSSSSSPLPPNTTSATTNNNNTNNNNTTSATNTNNATAASNTNNNNSNNNNNNNLTRQMSISSVHTSLHGPSIEIVPTVSLSNNPNLLHNWKVSWEEERKEWETRRGWVNSRRDGERRDRRCDGSVVVSNGGNVGGMELRRSNTDFGRGGTGGRNGSDDSITNGGGGIIGADKGKGGGVVRRNRSMPSSSTTTATTTTTTTTHKHNRYGKPTKLSPKPNPIVTKSSKKINRSHARYALTAGMMLGVRESVGGANGVECELEARLWEEREGQQQQQLVHQQGEGVGKEEGQEDEERQEGEVKSFEVVLGPITLSRVESLDNTKRTRSDNTHNNNNNGGEEEQEKMSFLEQQCTRITKYKFSPMTFYLGSNTSEPLPHKYKFKVYAPVVFQRIRSLFGVDKQTFLHSICGKFNLYEFASNAKSGQFFFYSHDGRYMIKTLTYTEQRFLRLILPAYYRHLTKYPNTFLTHFYGLYRVCMPNADNTRLHFVIMRSVFHTEKKIDRVWDLKGSTVGRKSEKGESVAKDLDILEEGKKLRFVNGSERDAFLKQLAVDAAFLGSMGIMDYSLLLGLHNNYECEENCCGSTSGSRLNDRKAGSPMKLERKRLERDASDGTVGPPTEPAMTNTPHRRNVLKRAAMNTTGSSSPSPTKPNVGHVTEGGVRLFDQSPTKSTIASSSVESATLPSKSAAAASNPITSLPDLGIQGGTPLRPETYYCGIIDILQYYNARKMGETVIKKAAGGDADNISCVDPETYGKRFVKFISDLVE